MPPFTPGNVPCTTFLSLRAADLSRLAMTIQTHLDSAEDTIQRINHSSIVKRR
jgi:hypothetical protein